VYVSAEQTCTTSGRTPATVVTPMYSGNSVVMNETSVSHHPCSSTFPCNMSDACNTSPAPSEFT
jgi:hypothetical protein